MLCLSQITSWGVLYYAFPVLATSISTSTGWSLPAITAGFGRPRKLAHSSGPTGGPDCDGSARL
ncbi:hypothetical protein [Saccharothrix texasensis]|uniref:hypothetical protein n=1 Tax=Saccharothrix texasensis TaxID=103734 RepID=UPI003CCC655D